MPNDSYVFPNLSALQEGAGRRLPGQPHQGLRTSSSELRPSRRQADLQIAELALNRNLMDFLKDDAKRIRTKLTAEDKERFDGYVDTFESLRQREQRKAALKDRIAANAPDYVANRFQSATHMGRMECQFELGTCAILSGLTNVITLRPDTLGAQYQKLGTEALGLHAIGHGTGTEKFTSPQLRERIDRYHMSLIAKMAARFAAVKEGDGTVLDNTLIVYTSCTGGKHHGGISDWPFVLVGGTGGAMKSGRYVQYPSYGNDGHKTIGNLYLSILASGGIDAGPLFGQIDPGLRDLDLKGPLSELMS